MCSRISIKPLHGERPWKKIKESVFSKWNIPQIRVSVIKEVNNLGDQFVKFEYIQNI